MRTTDGNPARATLAPPRANGGTGPESDGDRAQRLFREFRAQLNTDSFRARVAAMVPSGFRSEGYVDRLIESIFVACRDNPDLLVKCDRASLFRAAERIAKRGLTVGDNIAWLVPYKGQVQDQLGWKGAIVLVLRSGAIERITSQPVYEADRCTISLGTAPAIIHEPPLRGSRGKLLGVYAAVWLKGAADPDIEWMDYEEIEQIRSSAPSANSPAWRNWYSEMARGKVLKRLMKRQPTERPIDLSDMDDRQVVDIAADGTEPAALAAPTEQPIETGRVVDGDEASRPDPVQRRPSPSDERFDDHDMFRE